MGFVREHRRLASGRSYCDGHGVGLREVDRGGEREIERVRKRESESVVAGAIPRWCGQG